MSENNKIQRNAMIGNTLALLSSPRGKKDKKTSKNSSSLLSSTVQAQKREKLPSFAQLLTEAKDTKKTKKSAKSSLAPVKVGIVKQKEVQDAQVPTVPLPLTHPAETLTLQPQKNIKKSSKVSRQARMNIPKQSTQEQLLLQKQHKNHIATKKSVQTPLNEILNQARRPKGKTLGDVAKIAQDHKLNLTKLEIKSTTPKSENASASTTLAMPMQKIKKEMLPSPLETLTRSKVAMEKVEKKSTQSQKEGVKHTASHTPQSQVKAQPQALAQAPQQVQTQETKEEKTPTLGELLKLAPKQKGTLALESKEESKIEEKPKESKTQDLLMGELKRETSFKIASSKETLTQFSQRIREEILNYKPPFTKLSMELNPAELGKLEITITKKGKELQINVNANNANALHAFMQNQNEFRATLSNAGFSNVELNFSQGEGKGGGEKNQEQNQQKRNKNSLEESITEIPALASMEIKMVQYA